MRQTFKQDKRITNTFMFLLELNCETNACVITSGESTANNSKIKSLYKQEKKIRKTKKNIVKLYHAFCFVLDLPPKERFTIAFT